MPFLIFIFYPILELYLWVEFIRRFGWGDAFLWCVSSAIVGFWIVKSQSQEIMHELRQASQNQQLPKLAIAHRVVISLGGVLLILPGIASDVLGALLILPGLRHIILWFIYFKMASGAAKIFAKTGPFSSFVFQFGSNTYADFRSGARDVTPAGDSVIDITAKKLNDPESSGPDKK